MSYAPTRPAAYSAAQADDLLGWTPSKRRQYWDARARACAQFADEGACLAQVAKHVPVTIGALGDTSRDISTALNVTAGLFRDPDSTLRQYGPPIVTAADRHIVDPLLGEVGRALTPYVLKYVLPVILGLYVTTGISAYYSYRLYSDSRVRPNRTRRRRTSRRNSR
jgi:hypothetical protein